MKKYLAIIAALCISLTGCGYETTSETKEAEVSGCEIFRLKLKGESYPIFLAKCKDTATITYNTGGKSNHRGVTVTTIEKDTAELEQMRAELEKRKAALGKLSDEEKKVLGLQ